ncbi:two-component system response regulator TctD [Acidovorax delafieldii]|jgi:two-component system response regulator TctD|uniref:Two-component system response regulator TctD n=2 Tax=Comamonadaceae TaxID=80864 RepID=A0A561XKC7_ACIDE|nr:response regulator transcription factor [Acidovorax sp.]PIF18683.1 two-component system response regulator TctD [Acidovorax sp. 59]PKW02290.1 two-component system response regulator TctD [Acidovorax sp. 30]RMA61439.1 two-component system response regulator TctD [Acidovorax sp. 100]TWG36580.1 two-component system response regulator TctD [Acidovorax delafieldii]
MVPRMQLLLVEDDPTMQATLHRALTRRGMEVTAVGDGRAALSQWTALQPDAVILDLTLPGLDGLQVLQQARSRGLRTPVLILTARGTVGDRVVGLNAGADDYLPKPFDLDELEARLRALVRRSADPAVAPLAPSTVQIGAIRYDKDSGALYLNGEVMELTPRELALMHALLAQPGHAVTKERLYELVFPGQLDVQYEAIEVVVYRLRKKLAGTGLTLMTLRGLGYLLRADA